MITFIRYLSFAVNLLSDLCRLGMITVHGNHNS